MRALIICFSFTSHGPAIAAHNKKKDLCFLLLGHDVTELRISPERHLDFL